MLSFTPTKNKRRGRGVSAMLKRGHNTFWGRKALPCLECVCVGGGGGGEGISEPQISHFVPPPPPVINDRSLTAKHCFLQLVTCGSATGLWTSRPWRRAQRPCSGTPSASSTSSTSLYGNASTTSTNECVKCVKRVTCRGSGEIRRRRQGQRLLCPQG